MQMSPRGRVSRPPFDIMKNDIDREVSKSDLKGDFTGRHELLCEAFCGCNAVAIGEGERDGALHALYEQVCTAVCTRNLFGASAHTLVKERPKTTLCSYASPSSAGGQVLARC